MPHFRLRWQDAQIFGEPFAARADDGNARRPVRMLGLGGGRTDRCLR
jgi:hypothetical protein